MPRLDPEIPTTLEIQKLFAPYVDSELMEEIKHLPFDNWDNLTSKGWASNRGCTANALALLNTHDLCTQIQEEFQKRRREGDTYEGPLSVINPEAIAKNEKFIFDDTGKLLDCKILALRITDLLYTCIQKKLPNFPRLHGLNMEQELETLYPCKCNVLTELGVPCPEYKIAGITPPPFVDMSHTPNVDIRPGPHTPAFPPRCGCKDDGTCGVKLDILDGVRDIANHSVFAVITKCLWRRDDPAVLGDCQEGIPTEFKCFEHPLQQPGVTYTITVSKDGVITNIVYPPNSPMPTWEQTLHYRLFVGTHIIFSTCIKCC